MNIFVLDKNVEYCAQYHVDAHVIKMILESAQMLSTAVRSTGIDAGYKATHQNHPCNKWLRESISNWYWLKNLALALQDEWRFRYNHHNSKWHKSAIVIEELPIPNLPDKDMTPFALAMPSEYKSNDIVDSYRQYYIHEKAHIAKWKKREQPYWWNN